MSQRIHADSVNTELNATIAQWGNGTHSPGFLMFCTPIIGVVRFGYNVSAFFRTPPEGISRMDNIISGAGQMGRGLVEIIPIVGGFASDALNHRKKDKLERQAQVERAENDKQLAELLKLSVAEVKPLVAKGENQLALEAILNAAQPLGVILNVCDGLCSEANDEPDELRKEEKYFKIADFYLALCGLNDDDLKATGFHDFSPIVKLVAWLTDQAKPASLEKAKELVALMKTSGPKITSFYTFAEAAIKNKRLPIDQTDRAEQYIVEKERFALRYIQNYNSTLQQKQDQAKV